MVQKQVFATSDLRELSTSFLYKCRIRCTQKKTLALAGGPESLEDYFQKSALLNQKAALNLWYVDTRPNSQKLTDLKMLGNSFCKYGLVSTRRTNDLVPLFGPKGQLF